ncbi:MAG: spore germination protein [Lachnospiraceae bacterium]|nr:spore germination protein [Lachnospiraceae bacterium]
MSNKKQPITTDIKENEKAFKNTFSGCDDVKFRWMTIGRNRTILCFLVYIEVNVGNMALERSALGGLIAYLQTLPENEVNQALNANAFGLSDVTPFQTIEDAAKGLLAGDAILFVDGFAGALKIKDQGYPWMGVNESDTEKVVRGSNESFTESEKANTALIRKRIRSTRLKVKEFQMGIRSHTNVALVYIEDLADPALIEETHKRLTAYEIDGVLDSGVMEQLAEEKWYSPFPQFQSTRRPDRAAMSVLEGKVVVIVDNSPMVLLLPTDINSFLKTTDDYYNRFQMATFARILRYVSAFFSLTLPGLYLAMTNFHTQILPTPLLLSFWQARSGVPFPAALEVILMELSFELLREAGVRLPGAMGNTIGIVGGLIIGQSAVEANLVSPIVVIVVAFTALCSFAIPNEEFAFSFRILKFFIIVLSAWLGYFGFLVGIFAILIHLARLTSFDTPYLTPYVGPQLNGYEDEKDAIVRFPLRLLWKRPIYANRYERTKLKKKE